MITGTRWRARKIRDRVPMLYVTPEPYIGHMGLGGVGESKGMLESELRERHIEWLANSRIDRVDENEMVIETLDGQGQLLKTHSMPFDWYIIIPVFAGVVCVACLDW